jgi:gluconolactonase
MPSMTTPAVLALCLSVPAIAAPLLQQSPALPDAVVDLRTSAGAGAVAGVWRYSEAHITAAESKAPPGSSPGVRATHDIHPRPGTPDFDTADWSPIAPEELEARRGGGKLSFGWYRLELVVPRTLTGVDAAGSTLVLEVTVDDYAEVWVNGSLSTVLGQSGGQLAAGWNAPNRVVLTTSATPGETISLAVFASNAPLSAPPSNFVWVRSATLDLYRPGRSPSNAGEVVQTTITRLDAGLDGVIAPGTQARKLADGFVFTEGPVWVPSTPTQPGYLLFSDPNKNVIHRYDPRSGQVSIFRTKSGYSGTGGAAMGEYHQPGSNGLALDPQGRLAICEHGNRRVSRLEPNGTLTVLADRFESKRLNSPNDLVYRSDATLYFTDPPFGLPSVFDDPRRELGHSGVYRLRDGTVTLAAKDLRAPNGLAFSPDEKHLYVDNWEESRKVVLRYDVHADGTLSAPATFFDMTSTPGEICLDGLKVDAAGNVLVSGPGGVWVLSPAGTHLGTIALPELAANFAFGGDDAKTLFLCARSGLYSIRCVTGGVMRR